MESSCRPVEDRGADENRLIQWVGKTPCGENSRRYRCQGNRYVRSRNQTIPAVFNRVSGEASSVVNKLRRLFQLSEVRDLVFHVQEHRFTALQIRDCLEELGLKFCGFESLDVVSKFKDFFGENAETCDLSLWQLFEERNPRTFLGMYQFWCQKI